MVLSKVVIGNYCVKGFYRGQSGQSLRLYTSVDPVSAPDSPAMTGVKSGGAAGHCPRVRSAYYARVYRHSSLRNEMNIRAKRLSANNALSATEKANIHAEYRQHDQGDEAQHRHSA